SSHLFSLALFFFLISSPPPRSTLFPYTTLFRSSLAGLRVLVVEDEPDARELISLALKRSGAEVQTVASAKEALSKLQVFTPDVRSEEHTSELQSPYDLVCRLLLEKKKKWKRNLD